MKPERDTLITQTILLPVGVQAGTTSFLVKLYQRYCFYQRQYRTRRQLRYLSEAQLRDIGITAAQAEAESKKFFWQK